MSEQKVTSKEEIQKAAGRANTRQLQKNKSSETPTSATISKLVSSKTKAHKIVKLKKGNLFWASRRKDSTSQNNTLGISNKTGSWLIGGASHHKSGLVQTPSPLFGFPGAMITCVSS